MSTNSQAKRKRILLAKPGLDGHDRGVGIIMMALRDKGMEVIYLGLRQTPETIVQSAIQEDVNAIGLSFLNNTQMYFCPKILHLLQEKGADIPVVVGGLIPDEGKDPLKQMGIAAVFGIGSMLDEITDFFAAL